MDILKPRMAIDVDDCVNDLVEKWVNLYNKQSGANLQYEDFIEWDLTKVVPVEHYAQFMSLINTREFWDSLEPVPLAKEVLRQLQSEGVDYQFVTATDYGNFSWKCEWLLKHFDVDDRSAIRACDKSWINADIILDDNPAQLKSRAVWNRVIMTRPWNKNWDHDLFSAWRVNGWDDFYKTVKYILEIEKGW